MVSSRIAFTINEAKYGRGEYNIEVRGIEVRGLGFLLSVYPEGIGPELDIDVLERYGLAINFAKLLQAKKEFALSVSFSKRRNVYCGHILGLPTLYAKIIIDSSTVEFLAGGINSFLSLKEGYPIASARVRECAEQHDTLLEIYFCERVIFVP